ncbi:MAG: class I SAM-dependent methyltransferase [Bacteroidetes bacterium]|nr:MAG: class I SAM-dependent methyltransferase [Bacteroidota bacterium]
MSKKEFADNEDVQVDHMRSYYAFQAKIYDLTRWTFLYGRKTILQKLPFDKDASIDILEVGCGTGVNMVELAKIYPNARITGLDVSGDMLTQASKNLKSYEDRITLVEKPYGGSDEYNGKFDLILFSYSLTMINPQYVDLIHQSKKDIKEGGYVAVVDFHKANFGFYREFMKGNHVKLEGQVLPVLLENFEPVLCKIRTGLVGVWNYLMFVGK